MTPASPEDDDRAALRLLGVVFGGFALGLLILVFFVLTDV